MALPTTYSAGTASINANEMAVTGQGTTWLTSGIQAGDLFWAAGASVRIAFVNSNTSLTLAFAWPLASRVGQQYEVRFTPDLGRALSSARAVLDAIAGGELKAIGDLESAADKLPYFTGAGTAGLADFKAVAREFLARNIMGVRQGGGAGMTANNIAIGWDGLGKLLGQVDNVPLGAIWTDSLASKSFNTAGYVRLPNGLILQWFSASMSGDATLNYPIVFPNVVWATLGAIINSGADGNVAYAIRTQGLTASSFLARVRSITGGGVGPAAADASFIAIGY